MSKSKIIQAEYDYLKAQLKKLDSTDARLKQDLKHSLNVGSETWHDNDMFDTAKNQKLHTDLKRLELQQLLKSTTVIKPPLNPQTVQIGTKVILRDESSHQLVLKIGGKLATSLGEKYVSTDAPIVKLILDKKVGDTVNSIINDVEKSFTIIEIEKIKN